MRFVQVKQQFSVNYASLLSLVFVTCLPARNNKIRQDYVTHLSLLCTDHFSV